jgi:hypothetical protein
MGWKVSLDRSRLDTLKEIPQDLKEIFQDADYCLTLYMANIPDDSTETYTPTGLIWTKE